jgi:ATP adenylyltransferase
VNDSEKYSELEDAAALQGASDSFQRLWTPHRLAYIQTGTQPSDDECPFCIAPTLTDERALIVHRGKTCFVLLNLYPYNSGHLLVVPYRHFASYPDATLEEVSEYGVLTQKAMQVLKATSGAHGFNIGMNQGEVAGAGIAAHLHQHIVPRWRNDSNFFPIIAQTKALPRLLGEIRLELATAWLANS